MANLLKRKTMDGTYHQQYLENLAKGVEGMWLKQRHTDVTIKVDGKTYAGHKVVLGSLSYYFKDLFMSSRDEFDVTGMKSATFEIILQYIYTGKYDNVIDNVDDAIEAAVTLQIPDLQELCEDLMKTKLSPASCLNIYKLASSLGCKTLARQSWVYMLEFFESVSKTEEFGSIHVDDLIAIINDNDLNTQSEEAVCDAVIGWVSGDQATRVQYLEKLFGYVRFPLVSKSYIEQLSNNPVVTKSKSGRKILEEFGAYLSTGNISVLVNPKQFHHRTEEMVCIVGTRSRQPNPEATEIKCFSFNRSEQYLLASLPEEPGACFAVCSNNNNVYISGGYLGQEKMIKYVTEENKWYKCGDLKEGRWGHAMGSAEGAVYIFGGSRRIPEAVASIEKYDPSMNTTSIVGKMVVPVSFMAIATVGTKIFLFGGKINSRSISNQVQCFDTISKECSVIAELPTVDSSLSRTAVIDNTVYVFYGSGVVLSFSEKGSPEIVGSFPKFDHFGVVEHNRKVLIDGSYGNQSSTYLFDPVTKETTPFSRTMNAALCNVTLMSIVMSKNILKTCC